MGTESRKRYTFRDVPGPSVPLSFRVAESASMLLKDRVAKLIVAGEIKNQSEALQDALVTWLMIEEWKESQNGAAVARRAD
jgi:Arc/MetJ-type ribon-helix-helix transcriptional regulator